MKTLNTICQIAAFVLVLPVALLAQSVRLINANAYASIINALVAFVEGATAKNTALVIVLSVITLPVLLVQAVVAGFKVWHKNMTPTTR